MKKATKENCRSDYTLNGENVSKNKKRVGIMVKIRIQRKKEKRRDRTGILLPALLFFILFPYIISGFSNIEKQSLSKEELPGQIWVLQKKLWGMQKVPLEKYLTGMLAATIPAEYEMETLKAQAIILRSFCMNQMKKENGEKIIYDDLIKEYHMEATQYQEVWKENADSCWEKIQRAVEETKGVIIVCNGDIVEPPFCRMSNGITRDITEYVIHKRNYSHMKAVPCVNDKMAVEYIQYVQIPTKEFEEKIKKILPEKNKKIEKIILYRDANDYVKEIQIEDYRIEGESFRKTFNLISSCYSLEKIDDVIEIKSKGIGHGFGFSQYEANQLALKNNDYIYLLNYFFSNIALEKI